MEAKCECGKEIVWDINYRGCCEECLRNKYYEEFKKAGLDEKGFKCLKTSKGYVFTFYSHTTGLTNTNEERVLRVSEFSINQNSIFPYTIWLCNEYGLHEHTLGITKEFGEFLIKELKLVKQVEGSITYWLNPKIKQDKLNQEIALVKQAISKKRLELLELIKKLHKLQNEM